MTATPTPTRPTRRATPPMRSYRWVPTLIAALMIGGLVWAAACYYIASH